MLWPYEKHLSGVVSNLEPIPQCYGFMITSFDHLSIYATKTRTKIAYEHKTNTENLNEQNLSFLMSKTTKKSYSTTTFRIILLFRYRNK